MTDEEYFNELGYYRPENGCLEKLGEWESGEPCHVVLYDEEACYLKNISIIELI